MTDKPAGSCHVVNVDRGRGRVQVDLTRVPENTDSSSIIDAALEHIGKTRGHFFDWRVYRQHNTQTAQVYFYTN